MMEEIDMEEISFVEVTIHANPETLVPLLLEMGYSETGKSFHPTWRSRRGSIFSRVASPVFWIADSAVLGGYTILVWTSDGPISGAPYNMMIGHELLPILKESAEGIAEYLMEVLGKDHIGVSFESYPEKLRREWAEANKKRWYLFFIGKITIEIF